MTQWTTVALNERMELVHSKQPEDRRSASAVSGPTSVPDWTLVGHRAHAVQFYENDAFLIELLSRFVGASLVTGDSAIVVATPRHREALAERLRALGFNLTIPLNQKRYLPFDAAADARAVHEGRQARSRAVQRHDGAGHRRRERCGQNRPGPDRRLRRDGGAAVGRGQDRRRARNWRSSGTGLPTSTRSRCAARTR